MKDGFIKVAAATPDVRVADCEYNATEIIRMIHEMEKQGAKVMVFPELCITAYTCGDLFWQENLLEEAKVQLVRASNSCCPLHHMHPAHQRSYRYFRQNLPSFRYRPAE